MRVVKAGPALGLGLLLTLVSLYAASAASWTDRPPRLHPGFVAKSNSTRSAGARQILRGLPLRFIAHPTPAKPTVEFAVQGVGYTWLFSSDEAVFLTDAPRPNQLTPGVVRQQFLGVSPQPALAGIGPLAGTANFLLGNESTHWRSRLATYAGMAYRGLYPGIDLIYQGSEGHLKSEYRIAPKADPALIQIAYSGAQTITVRLDGALVVQTQTGELIDEAPSAYQEIAGHRQAVACWFRLLTTGSGSPHVGFGLGSYDPAYPLVIDPVLNYSAYLGGAGSDQGRAIAVDDAGDIYVTGSTTSLDFPNGPALTTTLGGGTDVFITKLVNTGGVYTYSYSTYLGGGGNDAGYGIAVDDAGQVYVTGETNSVNFPVLNALQGYQSGYDAFVAKLNPAGTGLVFATYLGGAGSPSDFDTGKAIAIDTAGNAYVTGFTGSTDFPLWSPLRATRGGCCDAFVTQLINAGGVITYGLSTYLGGSNNDSGAGIAVDPAGRLYVTGYTMSADFPTAAAISATFSGGVSDAFVTQLIPTPAGFAYGYSTYLGGSGSDRGVGIAADPLGRAHITGETNSTDFPVRHALQGALSGTANDVFVTSVISSGGVITYGYSTYLGGSLAEYSTGLALDSAGKVYVGGTTNSSDFPTRAAVLTALNGPRPDVFVTQLISAGNALTLGYSTYWGGSGTDWGYGLTADQQGNVFLTGMTASGDLPQAPAGPRGGDEAFVMQLGPGTQIYLPLINR